MVDPLLYPDVDVTMRGSRLYDRRQAFTFTEDLKADVTALLDWDDLPEHAHQYIMQLRLGASCKKPCWAAPT